MHETKSQMLGRGDDSGSVVLVRRPDILDMTRTLLGILVQHNGVGVVDDVIELVTTRIGHDGHGPLRPNGRHGVVRG